MASIAKEFIKKATDCQCKKVSSLKMATAAAAFDKMAGNAGAVVVKAHTYAGRGKAWAA